MFATASKLALALALVPPRRAAPWSSSSSAAIPPELLALPRAPLDRTRAPSRIAFGSCSNQRREQPIWDDVVLPRALDDNTFAALNQVQSYNNVQIVSSLTP